MAGNACGVRHPGLKSRATNNRPWPGLCQQTGVEVPDGTGVGSPGLKSTLLYTSLGDGLPCFESEDEVASAL
jgi:hypothetical protein